MYSERFDILNSLYRYEPVEKRLEKRSELPGFTLSYCVHCYLENGRRVIFLGDRKKVRAGFNFKVWRYTTLTSQKKLCYCTATRSSSEDLQKGYGAVFRGHQQSSWTGNHSFQANVNFTIPQNTSEKGVVEGVEGPISCMYPSCKHFSNAMNEQRKGDTSKAREFFEKSIKENPGDVRVYVSWSKMEFQVGRKKEARDILLRALKLDSSSAHVLCALAILEEKTGRVCEAREIFRKLVRVAPCDGVAWQAFALFEARQERHEATQSLFREGIQKASRCAYLWQAWGVYEQKRKRFREATDKFRLATAADPYHCPSWQAWAIVEEKLGNIEFARELFERALKVDPHSGPTFQAYAMMESRQGNIERARNLFKRGLQVDPHHGHLLHAWGQMEEVEGNFDQARQLYDWGVQSEYPHCMVTLKSWLKMETTLGYVDQSLSTLLRFKNRTRQIIDDLRMLRKFLESRSEADIHLFMQWLSKRAMQDKTIWVRIHNGCKEEGRLLQQWIERRSVEDIKSFYNWVKDKKSAGFLNVIFVRENVNGE
eukprot:jgi/Galph1/276/GphlegSOOS_G5057.1